MSGYVQLSEHDSDGPNTSNREVRVNCSGSSTSETSSASFAKTTNQSVQGNQILRNKNCFGQKFSGRVTLVDKEPVTFQWEITTPSTCRHVHDNRCFPDRVGCILPRPINRGSMVKRGTKITHQCSGAKSNKMGSVDFHKVQENKSSADRQYDSSLIPIKNGGTHSMQLLALAKLIWDYLFSRQITITAEYIPSHLNVIADRESREMQDRS